MMKSTVTRVSLAGLAAAVVMVAGCNVSVTDGPSASYVYPCGGDTGNECTTVNGTDYECRNVPDVGSVCVASTIERPPRCQDPDNDGWGVEGEGRITTSVCRACDEDEYRGCEQDCAPEDATVYPGYYDPCDGTDSNCDGETDDYVLCGGDDFDDSRTSWDPGQRRFFCEDIVSAATNKSPSSPDNTRWECIDLPGDSSNNRYCVFGPTSGNSSCSSHYVCSSGNWSCAN